VIERFFALAKQWRGIATRFDKLAITYRAGATLCAILTWVRLLGDTKAGREVVGDGVYGPRGRRFHHLDGGECGTAELPPPVFPRLRSLRFSSFLKGKEREQGFRPRFRKSETARCSPLTTSFVGKEKEWGFRPQFRISARPRGALRPVRRTSVARPVILRPPGDRPVRRTHRRHAARCTASDVRRRDGGRSRTSARPGRRARARSAPGPW